jgi:cysteine desulfurase
MHYVYLDYAATSPMDPEVIKEIQNQFKENYGNASSLHTAGHKARTVIENSRITIANFINAQPEEIFFVSSGTESDNLAIKGVAFKNRDKGNHIITSSIEHHAVLHTCEYLEKQGFRVSYIPVDEFGIIDLKKLEEKISDDTILISVMFANNEIGTIEPLKEIGAIARKHNILFHTDATQALGKVPIDVEEMNIDLLSASSHKHYGPKGVGLLYVRGKGKWKKNIEPLLHGGGHERGLRSSTEAVPLIAGAAKAIELCQQHMEEDTKRLRHFSEKIISTITSNIEDVKLNGHPDPDKRLPNIVNLGFRYIEGESILLSLDMEGIAASTGSACSSKDLEASHVLLAIGEKVEHAHGSLRISMGRFTTEEEIDYFLEKLPPIIDRLRKMSPLKKGVEYMFDDSSEADEHHHHNLEEDD